MHRREEERIKGEPELVYVDGRNRIVNQRHQIPVHTIGFGRERFDHDLELSDFQVPGKALANSRLAAVVSFHQRGYSGSKVRLNLKDGGKLLATREVALKSDGAEQTETLLFLSNGSLYRLSQPDLKVEKVATDNALSNVNEDGWVLP